MRVPSHANGIMASTQGCVKKKSRSVLAMIAILALALSQMTTASQCLSRLPNGNERIYVVQDADDEVGWSWQIEDGGLKSTLKASFMPEIYPEFSSDGGASWSTAITASCQVSGSLEVNLEKLAPKLSKDIS